MSQPKCSPDCDEHHANDCPLAKVEHDYWRRYFGQDNQDREQRRRVLEAMRPVAHMSEEPKHDRTHTKMHRRPCGVV